MTILRRIVRAIKPSIGGDPNFDGYYSRLIASGTTGVPSAHEARQDLDEMRSVSMVHRYL
jgi:hypothetical protein